ncbi:hypothetical protein [Limimaricola pyoseonensis]|uniref:Uncharacterized protein n=1 Tax=Limimaricola pyoseonensis TaxID=521013 RepID=A0A1G7AST3_9RHOB|nr:hypothetical protein [Limimaricola pyoseonensis]SDE17909.1 hypothetical protein SAMN04488567_1097 [Limimaricola pyoseonensis]
MKTSIAFALALALGGTAAAADTNGFALQRHADKSTYLTIDLVRADGDGIVEIVDATAHGLGPVIGSVAVREGANNDLRVQLERQPVRFMTAVLRDASGEIVATQRIDTN